MYMLILGRSIERPRHNINHKLPLIPFTMQRRKYYLLQFIQWQSILFGYTSLFIDFQNKSFKTNKFVKFSVIIINLLNIIFIINSIYSIFLLPYPADNNLIMYFSLEFAVLLRVSLSLVIIIMQPQRDQDIKNLLEKMLFFYNKQGFNCPDSKRDVGLRKLWFFNMLLFILHSINFIVFMMQIIPSASLDLIMDIYFLCSLVSLKHLIMLQHAAFLCFVYESFTIINYKLQSKARKVNHLSANYFDLCKLLQQLNNIFNPINCELHLNIFMELSLMLYSLIVVIKNSFFQNRLQYSSVINLYIVFILHIYIYYIICDHVWQLNRKIQMIILEFIEENYVNQELEIFTLQRSLMPIMVSVKGYGYATLHCTGVVFALFSIFLKFVMTCWSNWLLRLVLCHGILLGFTTIYVDVKRRIVNTYVMVKIFVFFKNILYVFALIFYLINYFEFDTFNNENPIISYAFIGTHFSHLLFCAVFIALRIKGDKLLKKWLQILLKLDTNYLDKSQFIAADRNCKIFLTLNYIIMTIDYLLSLLNMIPLLWKGELWGFLDTFLQYYLNAMQHYIMFHHGFILFYINNCFLKLNYQLQCEQIEPPLASIYFQLSILLQRVNLAYGPAIFIILLTLLLTKSLTGYTIIILFKLLINEEFTFEYILLFNYSVSLVINMCLYFLICHRLYETSKETQRILLKYCTIEENQEVESICLGRLILQLNINICGMLDMDLDTLFVIIIKIFLYIIVFVQIDFNELF
ncbi:hypothetical protein CVS40_5552 [Lucilia cuprina]|nr:hypothetical protein CVS40_5552 [Lucilia cuprina]